MSGAELTRYRSLNERGLYLMSLFEKPRKVNQLETGTGMVYKHLLPIKFVEEFWLKLNVK